jgi:hypothetical protein
MDYVFKPMKNEILKILNERKQEISIREKK